MAETIATIAAAVLIGSAFLTTAVAALVRQEKSRRRPALQPVAIVIDLKTRRQLHHGASASRG
jgi:hypothetical protein